MTQIPMGETLEWLGAACLVACGYIFAGTVLALAVAGAFFIYQAQCFSETTVSVGTTNKEQP